MQIHAANPERNKRPVGGWALVVGLLVLIASVAVSMWMVKTKPKAEPREPVAEIPLVDAVVPAYTSVTVSVEAMGVVIPREVVTLQAEVSGVVTGRHPELVPGGQVRAGESLIQLDDRNYRHILRQKQAALETAESTLRIEMGQQDIARKEWELIAGTEEADQLDGSLALREPQREAREADVEAAQAALDRAALDVERTQVLAPFNAVVLDAEASVGDLANTGSVLARLADADVFRVRLAVRQDQLPWIGVPESGEEGSTVLISAGNGTERRGRIFKRLAELDAASHMAQVLVEVEDPLNLSGTPETPVLLLNQYVNARVIGRMANGVCRVPRSSLHEGSTLWLMDTDNRLRMIPARIVWSDREAVYVNNTFEDGWRLVLSNLGAPVEGMKLSTEGEQP